MNIDIVMPENNEAELLETGEKLGFKELIFLYDDIKKQVPKLVSKKLKIHYAFLAKNKQEVDKAKRRYDYIFASAQRGFFEHKKIKYLINAESSEKIDFLYQRRAGLDDIMCRIAKEKNKIIVFNLGLAKEDRYTLPRMMQNAKLCRKYKIKTLIATLATNPLEMRAPKDIGGFARIIKLM
ncbi:hypothetical protein KY348_04895 [Candidatus Woesearchaeota archaeon]|nr:hypothetical protein [Candidatus Woesearchaeota archaeon]